MIKITFLGTVSGIPTKDRNHTAIVLEYQGEKKETLLFDCGEGTQKNLMIAGINYMKINKIFISHWHADHFAGLIPMMQTMNLEKRRRELKIFAPEAERFISNILDLGYFGPRFPITAIDLPFEGDEIMKVDEDEEYEIYSAPMLHSVPAVGFAFKEKDRWSIDVKKLKSLGLSRGYWLKKLKKLGEAEFKGKKVKLKDVASVKLGLKVVYSGDTKPNENMVRMAKDADLLIHDGTFLEMDEAKGKHHADVKEAARIAKESKVRQLVLTHLSRRYTEPKKLEDEAKKVFPNSKVAYDFMKITLK